MPTENTVVSSHTRAKIEDTITSLLTRSSSTTGADIVTDIVMSATKISSKIYKPISYDKAIADPIHGCQWKKAIKEELKNLEQYNT